MEIKRFKAPPNRWTFQIKPIGELVYKYAGDGRGWIDPFAGKCSPAEFTNDLNTEMPSVYHMEALDFCKLLPGPFAGVLFDPPYSYEQISRSYKNIGQKATMKDTQPYFYNKVKNAICDKVKINGIAISFGWSSEGFGKRRGFSLKEVLLICHGGGHYDTIVTVEEKVQFVMPGLT